MTSSTVAVAQASFATTSSDGAPHMSPSIQAAFMPSQQFIDAVTATATAVRGVKRNRSACATRHGTTRNVATPLHPSIQAASIASQQTDPTVSTTGSGPSGGAGAGSDNSRAIETTLHGARVKRFP